MAINHREQMRRRIGGQGEARGFLAASSQGSRPSIELRIDRLVLEGAALDDRYRIADAVQSELARLLTERGAPANLTATAHEGGVDAGAVKIDIGMRAAEVGNRIARAVYNGIGRVTDSPARAPRS